MVREPEKVWRHVVAIHSEGKRPGPQLLCKALACLEYEEQTYARSVPQWVVDPLRKFRVVLQPDLCIREVTPARLIRNWPAFHPCRWEKRDISATGGGHPMLSVSLRESDRS